ncbi:sensor histidine kinase [Microtetraspora fusca]|uniref:sensor histidine kinase n=1 Tax=Microtetraspora fusca TaxID=1997 RepID=UPI000834D7C4|nr:sensor histidine kinase [Microtetraspora fusca]
MPRALSRDAAIDLLLAATVAAVTVGGTAVIAWSSTPGRLPDWAGYLILVGMSALLVARRTAPALTMVAVLAGSLCYQVFNLPGGAFTIPPAVALFSAVSAGRRIVSVAAMVAWTLATFLLGGLWGRAPDVQGTVWLATWMAVILVGGEVTRARRERLRAEREEAAQAERAREEEARRRVTEERLRIARELHDVLAHSISVINLQAGVSEHLIDRDPQQARAALGAIRQASKEVLVELRSMLGVLRAVDDDGRPLAPAPGMDRLHELVERARDARLEVSVTLPEERPELPGGVDLAVYRIVQESLTNVIRHAGASRAHVTIGITDRDVLVEVADDGAGVPAGAPLREGNGLVGMRERVMAIGGEFTAGPAEGKGFRVQARLPARSAAA